jgi:hypothetical protein
MKAFLLAIVFVHLVSACGIEKDRRSQALGGIELVGKMEKELANFRTQEMAAEKSLLASAKEISGDSVELTSSLANDDMARTSAGADKQIQTITKLKTFSKGIAKNDADKAQKLAQLNIEYGALLGPIPSTEETSADTQKKFSELAKPLSLKVQLNELKEFKKELETNYNDVIKPKLEANKIPATTTP